MFFKSFRKNKVFFAHPCLFLQVFLWTMVLALSITDAKAQIQVKHAKVVYGDSAKITFQSEAEKIDYLLCISNQSDTLWKTQSVPEALSIPLQSGKNNLQLQFISDQGVTTKAISIIKYPSFTALIPPILAILLALWLKEVIFALFAGLWIGAALLKGSLNPLTSFLSIPQDFLIPVLQDAENLSVILFSLLIGGMVGIMEKNGSMHFLAEKIRGFATGRKKTQFTTWLLGIAIFFDDYTNTLVVGHSMRKSFDKYRISKEKLAYIVDSTAAPIASIAFITTWIGAQLNYIQSSLNHLPLSVNAYEVFFQGLAYAYYPAFTLFFILLLIYFQKDFGPMLKAEKAALSLPESQESRKGPKEQKSQSGQSWWTLLPIPVLILTALGGMYYTGSESFTPEEGMNPLVKLAGIMGAADPFSALLWASISGVGTSVIIGLVLQKQKVTTQGEGLLSGFEKMLSAIVILSLAWALAGVIHELETASVLTNLLSGNFSIKLLPALCFILAGFMAFATGSSWGTMAILYPIVLPLTYEIGSAIDLSETAILPYFYQVSAVVLAGAVFGDHCSPISDTTILSAMASDCHHIEHVRTQLPYALTTGAVALLFGHVLINILPIPAIVMYPIGGFVLYWIVQKFGKVAKN